MTLVSMNLLTQRRAEWRSVAQLRIPECNSLTRVNLPFRIRQVVFQLLCANGRVRLFVLCLSADKVYRGGSFVHKRLCLLASGQIISQGYLRPLLCAAGDLNWAESPGPF